MENTILKFLSPVVQSSPVTDFCLLAKATLGCGKTEETNMYHRMAFMVYALCSCMYYNYVLRKGNSRYYESEILLHVQ